MFRFVFVFVVFSTALCQEIFDVRIHEGAERGTRMTLSAAFQKATEPLGACFGQLETDVDWIEWRSSRGAFYTSSEMPLSVTKNSNELVGTLHLLCAGNRMHSFEFRVHISHRNHHSPTFSSPNLHFYVPLTLPIAAVIAKIEVNDHDPVIYNSERSLSFTKDESLVDIRQDGSLILKQTLTAYTAYQPIYMQVLAIDYGSPQLFSIANLTLTPVTVSQVRDARVNIARREYQIFEWEHPEYGRAEKFRLSIRRGSQTVYEEEVDGTKTVALTKINMTTSTAFDFRIGAVDVNGETNSDWKAVAPIVDDLKCEGECAIGGVPLCIRGAFGRAEQFVDARGSHCICYPGYVGVGCDKIDRCPREKAIEAYGGIEWPEVDANITLRLPCPYNQPTDNQQVERRCAWDIESGRATWHRAKERDKCSSQTSVLTHLGMMGTFAARATTVSALNTVTMFIRKLLGTPSFSRQEPKHAHFDQKIAEMAVLVLDSLVQTNIDRLEGNATQLRDDARRVVAGLGRSLPTPFALSSHDLGLYLKSLHWVQRAEPNDNTVGKKCRVQLPTIDADHIVRVACLSNATLFELLEPKSPVLTVSVDDEVDPTFTRMHVMLKAPDTRDNYTCVFFDEQESAWSTRGIRRLDTNHNGFVRCETNHLGVFSLLPDRLFFNGDTFWMDLASHMPTVTSFVTLICTILLLFMAAVQKNQPIDCAFLLYLFYVFMIHLVHLLLFVAPQVGEPFAFSSALHVVLQFCVIGTSALLALVLSSIHSNVVAGEVVKEDDVACCLSRPFYVFTLGIVVPLSFTITAYHFSDGRDLDIARFIDRVDWLFITSYLAPSALLFSVAIVIAVWNVYLGSNSKSNRRSTSDRFMSIVPAISASVTALFMTFFLCSTILLFFFRDESPLVVFLFCLFQFFHVVSAFFFASYLFRLRFLLQRGTSCSTTSLERKRDISRALLQHVDSKQDGDGGFVDAGFVERSHDSYSTHDRYMPMHNNIFDHAPMVSIV